MLAQLGAGERLDARGNEIRHLAGALEAPCDEEERGTANRGAHARPVARANGDVGDPGLVFEGEEDGAVCGWRLLATEDQPGDADRSGWATAQRCDGCRARALECCAPEFDRLHRRIRADESVRIDECLEAVDRREATRRLSRLDAEVVSATVANRANPDFPGFQDFGEILLHTPDATGYVRVDWFTPDGLATWGDGRTVILGTKGYIELRKYLDVARDKTGDNVYIVDDQGERHLNVSGQVGFRFFGELILDCLNRTEKAMTQAHAFKAAELCLRAQMAARKIA